MYQVHISHTDESTFDKELGRLKAEIQKTGHSALLFHVLNASMDSEATERTLKRIQQDFPHAPVVGCSSNANIVDGELVEGNESISIVCNVFTDPDTRIELMQLPLDYECQEQTTQALLDALQERPQVRAVEMITCVATANMHDFCQKLNSAPEEVSIFGGGAVTTDVDFEHVFVFSSIAPATNRGVVFVLYSGRNFHVKCKAVQGWRPLGMSFHITRADRMTLYELNGKPAFEVYNHYLDIGADENFMHNGLCFPLSISHKDRQVLRAFSAMNPEDGSLGVTADISTEQGECRIAYGDPKTIMNSVNSCAKEMAAFKPQGILAFSCAGRLMYWDPNHVNRETLPFQAIAPTAGFFTGGEIARHSNGELLHHNLTLVLVSLREGDLTLGTPGIEPADLPPMEFDLQMSLIGHMATFIGTASRELQDAYERMEALARTDGLTGLLNRREVERIIKQTVEEHAANRNTAERAPVLIMFDLDDFKSINDTCGHQVGDEVLRSLADLTRETLAEKAPDAVSGRWGGEEFMVLLPSAALDDAFQLAETLRVRFRELDIDHIGQHTMSLGVTQLRPSESSDRLCTRVDDALYRAKDLGKNQTYMER